MTRDEQRERALRKARLDVAKNRLALSERSFFRAGYLKFLAMSPDQFDAIAPLPSSDDPIDIDGNTIQDSPKSVDNHHFPSILDKLAYNSIRRAMEDPAELALIQARVDGKPTERKETKSISVSVLASSPLAQAIAQARAPLPPPPLAIERDPTIEERVALPALTGEEIMAKARRMVRSGPLAQLASPDHIGMDPADNNPSEA